jgi:hypothetical protein
MAKHIHLHIHDSAYSYNGTYDPKNMTEEQLTKLKKRQQWYAKNLKQQQSLEKFKIVERSYDKCSCK